MDAVTKNAVYLGGMCVKKRIWAGLMALCLVIALLPVTARAISQYPIPGGNGNILYTTENGQVQITGCDNNSITSLEIPSEIGGAPVTSIAIAAFKPLLN